jgi:hypothetical protein
MDLFHLDSRKSSIILKGCPSSVVDRKQTLPILLWKFGTAKPTVTFIKNAT